MEQQFAASFYQRVESSQNKLAGISATDAPKKPSQPQYEHYRCRQQAPG
jgi:hypothetical protein